MNAQNAKSEENLLLIIYTRNPGFSDLLWEVGELSSFLCLQFIAISTMLILLPSIFLTFTFFPMVI